MANTQNQITHFKCPECNSDIKSIGLIEIGKIVECHICGTECEIVSLDPLSITPLEEEK